MGTSEIYRAVLSVDEVVDALVSTCRGRGPTAGCRCSWCCARGTTLDGLGDRRRSGAACARTARRGTCPTRSAQIAEVPRTLSGKVLEVPVKRILMGTPVEQAASRESLANPEALDYFVDLAAT